MNNSHKEYIVSNSKELVRLTDYKTLIRACEEENLLSKTMCDRIKNLSDATEEQKHMELFYKITKRGPQAFDKLIEILIKLDFSTAAALLHGKKTEESTYISMHNKGTISTPPPVINTPPISNNVQRYVPDGCYPSKERIDDSKLPLIPVTEKIILDPPLEVKKSETIQQNPKMPVYPMKSKNRGVFVMVNIIDFPKTEMKKRLGADIDGKHLLYLFQELGFTCFSFVNISSEQFFDVLDRLCRSEYTAKTESFVLILMSHGEMTKDMHDRVEFHDGSIVKLVDIEDRFTNVSCYNLRNKPKVLIFPFCRGPTTDIGISNLEKDGYPYHSNRMWGNIPTKSDMIVCYATVGGFQTMRDKYEGSWYVQTLCKIFAEYAHDTHLEDMLKIIGGEIKKFRSDTGEMQTPAFNNHGFTKFLFFNPGVYEE